MPRAKAAAVPTVEKTTRRAAPVAERKRTPVRKTPKLAMPEFDASAHHDEIAHCAYLNYMQRAGGPGSPEEDWDLAVSTVRAKYVS